jgi:hypothetical protein
MDSKRYDEILKETSTVKRLPKHGDGFYTFAEIETLTHDELDQIEILYEQELLQRSESNVQRLEKHGDGCYTNAELEQLSCSDWAEIEERDLKFTDAFYTYKQAWGY